MKSVPRTALTLGLIASAVAAQQTTQPPPPQRGFDWRANYTFGYRFLDVDGSKNRFDTDYNLREGFRLSELRFDGTIHTDNPVLDRISIEGHDVADPYERARATFAKDGLYEARFDYQRTRNKYRASGDFNRVDRKEWITGYGLEIPLGDDVELTAGFSRADRTGYWLVNRIGNRNLTPLVRVPGVDSPRHVREDEAQLGLRFHHGSTSWSVGGDYLNQRENARWSYSRAATANPAFTESEDTVSDSTLEGPGGNISIRHTAGPLDISLRGRGFERQRRIVGRGSGTGFDTAQFNSTLQSFSEGAARTYLVDGTIDYELQPTLTLHSDLRYLDHTEHLVIDQTDTTVYPTVPTTATVYTLRTQRTTSRRREASLELEWQAHPALWVSGGWGWSQEKLRVPDLESGDSDFLRGTIVEEGWLGGFLWKPTAAWSLRGRYREFGQGGVQLHDIVDHHTRLVSVKLRHQQDHGYAELAAEHRRSQNPIADSRTANTTWSASAGYNPSEKLSLTGSYALAQIDSRTRTTFYFDPTPTPVSTLVGFHGDTHNWFGSVDWQITERLKCSAQGTYTTVSGDFEVDMLRVAVDASLQLNRAGRIGLRVEQVDYDEHRNPDDYDAWIFFVYFSAELNAGQFNRR